MSLWRVEEAADYLGIRPKTLYEWVRTGRVPHRKIGFNVRFDPDELEAWTVAQAEGPAPGGEGGGDTGGAGAETAPPLPDGGGFVALADEAAGLLRKLERDVGTHLSFPERRRLADLVERLEKVAASR